jgi:hypothetical protein
LVGTLQHIFASCSNIKARTFRCHRSKSRTTSSQEGENDEGITDSDTTTIACFYSEVNRFFIIIVFNTFDELLLHYGVCWLSYLELDWGPNLSYPHTLHRTTTSLLAQRWKEINANTFWALDSHCMTGPTCNGCHDLTRTPFGTFFIWLERNFDGASNGTSHMAK